jgi:hypothetical protein
MGKKTRAAALALAVIAIGAAHGCASGGSTAPPPPGPVRWSAAASDGRVRGEIGPDAGSVAVGEFQTWTVALRLADGRPLTGARLAIGGGMPQHGHGLPTQPRVTAEFSPGHYRIEGLKLNMHGDWVLEVAFESRSGAGVLRFPVHVDF